MIALSKTCACGRRFRTTNPLRRRCDVCQEDAWLDEFVPLTTVSDGLREFYGDILEGEGIPSLLKTSALARYGSGPSMHLWVRRRDVDAASQVLGLDLPFRELAEQKRPD